MMAEGMTEGMLRKMGHGGHGGHGEVMEVMEEVMEEAMAEG